MFSLIHSAQKLSSLAVLASLGLTAVAAPPVIAARVAPISTDSDTNIQDERTTVSNIFNLIEDAVETVEQVDRLLDQVTQPSSEDVDDIERVDEVVESEAVEETPSQEGSEALYQELAKRSNETHEEWWDRVEPTILYMPGEDYRAWKATLSDEDREAYDAVTRQRNYERTQQAEELLPILIEEALRDDRPARPNSCNYVEDASIACQQR
jgi:hypothetical protein